MTMSHIGREGGMLHLIIEMITIVICTIIMTVIVVLKHNFSNCDNITANAYSQND